MMLCRSRQIIFRKALELSILISDPPLCSSLSPLVLSEFYLALDYLALVHLTLLCDHQQSHALLVALHAELVRASAPVLLLPKGQEQVGGSGWASAVRGGGMGCS